MRMKTPITSWPCSTSRDAATLESTPPLIATSTFRRVDIGIIVEVAIVIGEPQITSSPATDIRSQLIAPAFSHPTHRESPPRNLDTRPASSFDSSAHKTQRG